MEIRLKIKNFLTLAVLWLCVNPALAQSHVVFGEMEPARYATSFCFDKNGALYPEILISDRSMRMANGELKLLLQKDSILFKEVSTAYHCTFSRWDEKNFEVLQDSIIQKKLNRLLKSSQDSSFTFLIHGFRKAFRDTLSDWTSQRDHQFTKETFRSCKTRFIEIYWDAEYGCCFGTNSQRNRELFLLFEKAQQNSSAVGARLSKILSGFKNRQLNIIAHSLGAKVTVEACALSASRNITCLLIAPAIGHNYLAEKIESSNCKHQQWIIVYNKHDFVLKKKDPVLGIFGPGPFRYGITTLGCNHRHAVSKLINSIAQLPPVEIHANNFSFIGKNHHLRTYLGHNSVDMIVGYLE